jgi:hypothetical protein
VRRLTGGEGKVGKKVQELTVDFGVVGIVERKLGGGGSTRDRAGTTRFQRRRQCSGDWSAGRRREISQGASATGDVMLMVLLAMEEKGWNFGSTRIRTAAESEIAGVAFWAARTWKEEEEWIRKGQ